MADSQEQQRLRSLRDRVKSLERVSQVFGICGQNIDRAFSQGGPGTASQSVRRNAVQFAQAGSSHYKEQRYIRSQLAKAPKPKELDSIRIEHEKKVNNQKRLYSDYWNLRQRNVRLVRAFFVENNPLFLGNLATGLLDIQRDDPSAWQEFEQLRTRYYEAFPGDSGGIGAPELGHLSSEIWRKNSELTRSGRNYMYKIRRFLQK